MEAILLHDQALDEIYAIGMERAPAEACGILFPHPYNRRWVAELPNRSLECHNSFLFTRDDMKMVLKDWLNDAAPEDVARLTIWHTHPSGGVGPSRVDMQNRFQHTHNLVVTLTDEGPVPSWY